MYFFIIILLLPNFWGLKGYFLYNRNICFLNVFISQSRKLPVSVFNVFEKILICKIRKLRNHWTPWRLWCLWIKFPRKTFSETADSTIFQDEKYLGKFVLEGIAPGVTAVMRLWYKDGYIIAQCFLLEGWDWGWGWGVGISREEPRMVGLASAFPTNLREGHGAGSWVSCLGSDYSRWPL